MKAWHWAAIVVVGLAAIGGVTYLVWRSIRSQRAQQGTILQDALQSYGASFGADSDSSAASGAGEIYEGSSEWATQGYGSSKLTGTEPMQGAGVIPKESASSQGEPTGATDNEYLLKSMSDKSAEELMKEGIVTDPDVAIAIARRR